MMKFHAHDVINDVAVIETSFCFNVRYGLQVRSFDRLDDALRLFARHQRHALAGALAAPLEEG